MGWLRDRRERQRHNAQDYYCRFWTGDRAGYDLRARCHVCHPEVRDAV